MLRLSPRKTNIIQIKKYYNNNICVYANLISTSWNPRLKYNKSNDSEENIATNKESRAEHSEKEQ